MITRQIDLDEKNKKPGPKLLAWLLFLIVLFTVLVILGAVHIITYSLKHAQ